MRAAAVLRRTTVPSSRRRPPGLHPLYQWQLCKTCNSQLYNITASGNNKRTTELTDELRALLGGSEYLLSTVVPHLGTQELRAFIASLTSSAAATLAGTAPDDAMGRRPQLAQPRRACAVSEALSEPNPPRDRHYSLKVGGAGCY